MELGAELALPIPVWVPGWSHWFTKASANFPGRIALCGDGTAASESGRFSAAFKRARRAVKGPRSCFRIIHFSPHFAERALLGFHSRITCLQMFGSSG